MINYSKAKEIFFAYSSSKFQMMRDGLSAEYYSYQVPAELESQWLTELIEKELRKLDINNPDSLFPLSYILEVNCNSGCLKSIIAFIEDNKSSAINELSFLKFTGKVLDTIDRLESCCSKINRFQLEESHSKLRVMRDELR